jgi:hypothetical protein
MQWTIRAAGAVRSESDDGTVVVDPSLSPDWLRMPPELGGDAVRVEGSCWLPLAPNPKSDQNDKSTWWLEQKTRWHILKDVQLVVAEVVGHGWVVLDPGPERRKMLREHCGLGEERQFADA